MDILVDKSEFSIFVKIFSSRSSCTAGSGFGKKGIFEGSSTFSNSIVEYFSCLYENMLFLHLIREFDFGVIIVVVKFWESELVERSGLVVGGYHSGL